MNWLASDAGIVAPARRDDVIVHELDGEALLIDPVSGDTIRLNSSALAIWQGCDGITDTRAIAMGLSEHYEIDPDTALDHVEQVVTVFLDAGLLADRTRP